MYEHNLFNTVHVLKQHAASSAEGGGAVLRQAGAARSCRRKLGHRWREPHRPRRRATAQGRRDSGDRNPGHGAGEVRGRVHRWPSGATWPTANSWTCATTRARPATSSAGRRPWQRSRRTRRHQTMRHLMGDFARGVARDSGQHRERVRQRSRRIWETAPVAQCTHSARRLHDGQ